MPAELIGELIGAVIEGAAVAATTDDKDKGGCCLLVIVGAIIVGVGAACYYLF